MVVRAYGMGGSGQRLAPMDIPRRAAGPHDVEIDIAFCGVCHSDVGAVESASTFPLVPGHEIVGRVATIGGHVTRYQVGDLVGIAGYVDSCRHCENCDEGLENYCDTATWTYGSASPDAPGHTLGGYSQRIVADERYVLRIRHPEAQLAAVAPLLCAGITTYSPLKYWKTGPGKKVGVIGIGGLGHMGVKIAKAMGAEVVAFTTSESKREEITLLGADTVVVSRKAEEMAAQEASLDLILSSVAVPFDFNAYLALLKRDGVMSLMGGTQSATEPVPQLLVGRRRGISGSLVGGIPEIQEMLDFCAARGIVSDIELIRMDQIDEAYERMLRSDVKYRFVIDNSTLAA